MLGEERTSIDTGGANAAEEKLEEAPLDDGAAIAPPITERSIPDDGGSTSTEVDLERAPSPAYYDPDLNLIEEHQQRIANGEFGTRHYTLRPDLVETAVAKVAAEVMGADAAQTKLKGVFLLDQVNHVGLEQERLLIVAKDAMYRVTWSFAKSKLVKSVSIPFTDIKAVVKATLKLSKKLKAPGQEFDTITGQPGVRVFTSLEEPTRWQRYNPKSKQPFHTYKVHQPTKSLSPSTMTELHDVDTFFRVLSEAVDAYDELMGSQTPNKCREEGGDIEIKAGTGITHYLYNGADAGREMDTMVMIKRDTAGMKASALETKASVKKAIKSAQDKRKSKS